MKNVTVAIAASCLLASPALAETRLHFEPLPQEGATVRYENGTPTMDLRREHGAVQVTPLGLDHGRLTFGISFLNMGEGAANFGVENIRASAAGRELAVLTRERLDQMARNRAMWSQVAVAVAAGVGAYAASTIGDGHYGHGYGHGHGYGYGYGHHGSYHDADGLFLAAASVGAGAVGIGQIQSRLDATRAALGDEIIQTTTVDPGDGYGGRIVIDRIQGRNSAWPQEVVLRFLLNGEDYPFAFRVTRAQ